MLQDALAPGVVLQLQDAQCLFRQQSPWQLIEVWQSPAMGRVFVLDGCFMTAEADEFIYHETLVHPNALSIAQPRSALIVGGGDGGSLRQLCAYSELKHIDVVELDECVVRMARDYLWPVHRGALDDERVHWHFADGYDWLLQQPARQQYDLIILDLTDPVGLAARLYSPAFFAACAARLQAEGLLSLHVGHPFFQPQRCRQLLADLRAVFPMLRPCLLPVTLYGGVWMMASASLQTDIAKVPLDVLQARLQQHDLRTLSYYTPQLHAAQLQLPGFAAALLPDAVHAAGAVDR